MAEIQLITKLRDEKGQDAIGRWFRSQILDLASGKAGDNLIGRGRTMGGLRTSDAMFLGATLTLNVSSPKYAYWWYQEFGAGQFFKPPKGTPPILTPSGVLPYQFGNTVQNPIATNKNRGDGLKADIEGPEVTSKLGRILHRQRSLFGKFYRIKPRRGRSRLRYYKDGGWRYPMVAWHPGFQSWQVPEHQFGAQDSPWGRGLIRVTLWQARLNMEKRLKVLMKSYNVLFLDQAVTIGFDLRKEIVAIINDELEKAARKLNRLTPVSKDTNVANRSHMNKPYHLRGAWGVKKAV